MMKVSIFLFVFFVGSTYAGPVENETAILMAEIMTESARMWIDTKNYGSKIDLNYQDKYEEDSDTKYDKFMDLEDEEEVLKDPTIVALNNLFAKYTADKDIEDCEEVKKFVEAIWDTPPMEVLKNFIVDNQTLFEDDEAFKTNFTEIWFRGFLNETNGKNSSGFQHVFMGEKDEEEAHGFHNWVRYYNEEKDNRLTYKGWTEKTVMGEEVPMVSLSFEWEGATKPVSTIAFGTKPEYEMAVLTLCWYMMPGDQCYVAMLDGISNVVTESYEEHVHTAYFTITQPSSSGILRPDFFLSIMLSLFFSLKYSMV